ASQPAPVPPASEEPVVAAPIRPRKRILDFPTTLLTYTGGALMLAGVVGLLTSGALQATDGQPGGTCSYRGQVLTGADCAANYTSLFQIGYGVSAGALVLGGALLGGGLYRYKRAPLWPTK
ncbi:MAG TPA: hypothetical protein PLW65_08190, partial [Pseudomonadota bacterium]|nr:hypothetical protein [Pseudomonadota bacterium]